jgi:hypothetical protein
MCGTTNDKTGDWDITILEDGTVKIETQGVAPAHHMSAEKFMIWLTQEMGGFQVRTKRTHTHNHERTGRQELTRIKV